MDHLFLNLGLQFIQSQPHKFVSNYNELLIAVKTFLQCFHRVSR